MAIIILLCYVLLFELNSRSFTHSITIRFSIESRQISNQNSVWRSQLPRKSEEGFILENNLVGEPSAQPTSHPTAQPTIEPTSVPTAQQSSMAPLIQHSTLPSMKVTTRPSATPSIEAPATPSIVPSSLPSVIIPAIPISLPPITISKSPSCAPSFTHPPLVSTTPISTLTIAPSIFPSILPSIELSTLPSTVPNLLTTTPSAEPTRPVSKNPPTEETKRPSTFPLLSSSFAPSHKLSVAPSTLQPTQSLPNSDVFIQVSQLFGNVNMLIATTLPAQTAIRSGISRALKVCADCVAIKSVSANNKQRAPGNIRVLATSFSPGILVSFTVFFNQSSITLSSLKAEVRASVTSGTLVANIKRAAIALNISTLFNITIASEPLISAILTYAPSTQPSKQQFSTVSSTTELLAVTISFATLFGCCIIIIVAVYLRQRSEKSGISGSNVYHPGDNDFYYSNELLSKSQNTQAYSRSSYTQPRQSLDTVDSADPGAVVAFTNPMTHRSISSKRINKSGTWSLFSRNSLGFGVDASKFVDDYIVSSIYEPQSDTLKGTESPSQSVRSSRIILDSSRDHGRASGTPMNLSLSSTQENNDSRYPANPSYTADKTNSVL